MKPSKIKAFAPLSMGKQFYDWCGKAAKSDRTAEVIEYFIAKDPGATDWNSLGFVEPVEAGRYVHDLDGTARMLMMQFNERILPSAVRDERLSVRYKELTEKEGRALDKKEFAQLREDVEYELLPKAFIRRTIVPVLVYPKYVLVCTTSMAKVEKVMVHVSRLCSTRNIEFDMSDVITGSSVQWLLKVLASEGVAYAGDDDETRMSVGSSAVFRGEDKRTVRVKDRQVLSEEVAHVVSSGGYSVIELGMDLDVFGEQIASFTLNEKFVVKGIKLSDVTTAGSDADDLHSTYWLYAKTLLTILSSLVELLSNDTSSDADEEL